MVDSLPQITTAKPDPSRKPSHGPVVPIFRLLNILLKPIKILMSVLFISTNAIQLVVEHLNNAQTLQKVKSLCGDSY
jgi:hypothetical protein